MLGSCQQPDPPLVNDCVHYAFHRQATRTPDAPAIASHDASLSYRQLDDYSNRVALMLQARNVGPEVVVPLVFEKSAWAIVAMLAVMKAGGACANISPSYPVERTSSIVRQCGASIILTNVTDGRLQGVREADLINITRDTVTALPPLPSKDLLPMITPENAAYILFTSGSTGEPKGIVVEHGSLCTCSAAHGSKWGINPVPICVLYIRVADIFFSLMRGACICTPSEAERLENLSDTLTRLQANWAFLTPSVAATVNPASVTSLRTLLLGGEAATHQNIQNWAESVDLIICTGPAECSVYCMGSLPCTKDSDPANVGFPIGGRLWVTKPQDPTVLVAPGEIGELVIEGRIVARGYLKNPEATAKSFLVEPPWLPRDNVASHPRRVYRTGDLIRQNADGSYNFIGRSDDQVKVRGQRVELGEIETTIIQASDSLARVKVLYSGRTALRPRESLTAFVEFKKSFAAASGLPCSEPIQKEIESIRRAVAAILPSYMVPSHFLSIEKLPLTLNGKADVKSLRQVFAAYEQEQMQIGKDDKSSSDASMTTNELLLRSLWARVLKLNESSIGPQSDFVRLGGSSLSAMELVGAARAERLNLSFGSILELSKLSEMAAVCSKLPVMSCDDDDDDDDDSAGIETPSLWSTSLSETESDLSTISAPFSLIDPASLSEVIAEAATLCNVSPERVLDLYPVTPLQEDLIALSQSSQDNYVSTYCMEALPTVDLARIKGAWEQIYDELEILRTRLVYLSDRDLALQAVIDEKVTWKSDRSVGTGFDAKSISSYGSPLSQLAIRESDGKIFIVWNVHHSLIDGVSISLIFNRVAAIYQNPSAPTSIVPFKSFIEHQASLPKDEARRWWAEYLDGAPASHWPRDTGSGSKTLRLAAPLNSANRPFTLASYLKTAWAYLIGMYSNSSDVVFGCTNWGRSSSMPGVLSVVGPTITTVPYRIQFTGDSSISDILSGVQSDSIRMAAQDHIGLLGIRKCSANMEEACRFHSLLIIQPAQPASELDSVTRIDSLDETIESYPLVMECKELNGGVELVLTYQTDAIPHRLALSLLRQKSKILEHLLSTNPETSVTSFNPFTKADLDIPHEGRLSLYELGSSCIHTKFYGQVQSQPTAPSVNSTDVSWDYETLDRLSTDAAYALLEAGIDSSSIVPICSPKSPWVIVSMLAVLKSGATFLPLDASNPPDRLQRIIQRVQPTVILAPAEQATLFQNTGRCLICPSHLPTLHRKPAQAALPEVSSSSLAYIMFTSGSTGEPKGVEVEHAAYCVGALTRAPHIERGPGSRVYQFASYGFDTSIEDIFTTLITGGCVCVAGESERRDDLTGSFTRLGANTLDITPSLESTLDPATVPSLRTLILGGEALSSPTLVAKWADTDVTLINTYGPTETAIVTSVKNPIVADGEINDIGILPCGRAWVVHSQNHHILLPRGAVGELLVEGPNMARGYFEDGHQTARAFVTDVAWAPTEARFYKTGDLVRFSTTGESLIFVGRKDAQVKIRGQRVELLEVATHVQQASGALDVVADFVSLADQSPTLLAFLRLDQSLHEFSVLPITQELGDLIKRCEKSLLDKIPSYMELKDTDAKPLKTKEEILLASLWAKVLHLDPRTLHAKSNFFRSGGDSLTAMRLSATARGRQIELSVSEIFRTPSLVEMAQHLSSTSEGHGPVKLPPLSLLPSGTAVSEILQRQWIDLSEEDIEDIYPCTPTQEGMMALGAKQPGAYVAQFEYVLQENIDIGRLRSAWNRVVKANPILRTRILLDPVLGSLQLVTRSTSPSNISATGSRTAMTYGTPLFRFEISAEPRASLTLLLHHAVFDGFSLVQIQQQVVGLYMYPESSQEVSSFAPFMAYLSERDKGKEASYWRAQLSGSPSTDFLIRAPCTAQPRVENHLFHHLDLPSNQSNAVSELGVTIPLVLRAAWALTISTFTFSEDLVFAEMLSGRNAFVDGIWSLNAPTVTTVPIRCQINRNWTVREFLESIRLQAAEMIPFEQTGLQNIEKYISQSLDASSILVIQPDDFDRSEFDSMFVSTEPQTLSAQTADYYTNDLVLEVKITKGGVDFEAIYDSTRIPSRIMSSVLTTVASLTTQIFYAQPDETLVDLRPCPVVGKEEQAEAGHLKSNDPTVNPSLICDLIFQGPSYMGQKQALVSWEGTMTFAELDSKSTNLARYLQSLHLEGDTIVVPLLFEKSLNAIIAILAVLKAGYAYTALDPTHPAERLRDMVQQVKAQICLVSSVLSDRLLGVTATLQVIDHSFLASLETLEWSSKKLDRRTCSADSAAVIVFTSGSTGRPKAIVLSHDAITSHARLFGPQLRITRNSRVLCNAAWAFDIHAFEILVTLIAGGTLFLTNKDRSHLAELIGRWKINWLFSTPSALKTLDDPSSVPTLESIVMVGELPSREIYERWSESHLTLINGYGPAENTFFSTMAVVERGDQDPRNIGFPINTRAWIMDPNNVQNPLPRGAVGELVVAGRQLAQGYLHNETATNAAFVPAPPCLEGIEDGLIYRTGDLCQFTQDGSLWILGRVDSQVKLRGQRLETAEVEHHLVKSLGKEAAVDVATLPSKTQVLLAFVKVSSSNEQGIMAVAEMTDEFRHACGEAVNEISGFLPNYMVPTHFIPMAQLPHTASDKLDRKRLREYAARLSDESNDLETYSLLQVKNLVPPAPGVEQELQSLWSQLLEIDPTNIGANSQFTALGGNSITAIRLATMLRQRGSAGGDLTVADILQYPALKDMAKRVRIQQESLLQERPSLLPEDDRKELIASILSENNGDFSSETDIEDVYPCTPLQAQFMHATLQSSHAYISHHIFSVKPGIDGDRLAKAWHTVINRHSIFRTRILQAASGDLLQVVRRTMSSDQCSTFPSLDSYLKDLTRHLMPYPSPLFKVGLITGGSNTEAGKVVITAHHSAFDAWTLEKLPREVTDAYMDRESDEAVPFSKVVQLVRSENAESLKFWKEYLAGSETSPIGFTDRSETHLCEEKTVSGRYAISQSPPSNLVSTITRAAWGLVLASLTESTDVTYGVILNGRTGENESVMGPTVTTIPFRVNCSPRKSLGELIQTLERDGNRLLPFQHISLDELRKLSPEAAQAVNFNSILDIEMESAAQPWDERVLALQSSEKLSPVSNYYANSLIVACQFAPNEMKVQITFDSNQVPEKTAARMISQLHLFFTQLTTCAKDTRIHELELLVEEEKALIRAINQSELLTPAVHGLIHDLVARSVVRKPTATAIDAWDGSLTYAELHEITSKLARHLIRLGVTVGSKVPVCFDKSIMDPITKLACLKAGAAYVPLDPSHPTERLRKIVQFIGSDLLIAGESQHQRFEGEGFNIVVMDRDFIDRLPNVQTPLPKNIPSSTTAIVVFTSGSTGMPKGVELSHRSLCTLAAEVGDSMDFARLAELRLLQFAAYAFDVSNTETFLTLIFGGTLCIVPDHERMNHLAEAVNRLRINWLFLTPSSTKLLRPEQVPGLHTLILGGEAPTSEIIATWAHRVHLINSFGPAEGGIWPSMAHFWPGSSPTNIGRSGATKLWLVSPSDHHQLMGPMGMTGELLLEGPMLASGYLNEPEKTAAAFVRAPRWAAAMGAKGPFYKTGDLCCYNEDGTMSYVGRKDATVKIRGQRMDLAEVEVAIHKASEGTLVDVIAEVVRFTDRKDPFLVAFCADSAPSNGDLCVEPAFSDQIRGKLQKLLPSWMVPTLFLGIRKIPLTVSGKRDRKSLRELVSGLSLTEITKHVTGAQARQVTGPTEVAVRRAWAEVLGIETQLINASDNFLQLGGNSIDAMKLVCVLRTMGLSITVAKIFRSKDLSDMATLCHVQEEQTSVRALPPPPPPLAVAKASSSCPIPDLPSELRDSIAGTLGVSLDQIEAVGEAGDFQSHCYYFGTMASRGTSHYSSIHFPQGIEPARLQAAFSTLVAQTPILRTAFLPYQQCILQVVCRRWELAIEVIPGGTTHGPERLREWIAADLQKESTLSQRCTRGAILECPDGSSVFVFQHSHARKDAWTDNILFQDLQAIYNGRAVPARPTYLQLCEHLQRTTDREATAAYWQGLLRGSQMTPIVDSSRPSYANIVNVTLQAPAVAGNTSALGITTATVLKAAWALVLAEFTHQPDVVFGHLTSGRSVAYPEIDQVLGPCVNIIPVRLRALTNSRSNDNKRAVDLLRETQQQHIDSLEHEWMGEREIVRRCTDWAPMTRFSSVVQYQNVEEVQSMPDAAHGGSWEVRLHGVDWDSTDVWVLAWPEPADDLVQITLCFSPTRVPPSLAERMLARLRAIFETLGHPEHQDAPLPIAPGGGGPAQLPLSITTPATAQSSSSSPQTLEGPLAPSTQVDSESETDAIRSLVDRAWAFLWASPARPGAAGRDSRLPYYALSAAPWTASSLAFTYRRHAIDVSTEDIIDHPTMEAQVDLLRERSRLLHGRTN
ncbi:acetyl-CoA synthetase-like protein [Aspergillus uvarum CBS 121591]|uniref:Acetyl-CoA synthetase-like protein n=1 Tax=Aspergillus uvarum CBS 121591 TaxID=1448315 RepID=A0A319CS73_9EURO|nr:acetyl-CoA synthetase-like protein [Aspergillus uvarum CBS 121591]PYH87111.1 acetyl-CoA synthetase-like protein [Aspergillus uvarum CBS 121591]